MSTNRSYLVKTLLAALSTALVLALSAPADAGRGATFASIDGAIRTGNADAIVAELERAENIACSSTCMSRVMELLQSDDYRVREVAAWWFARRPAQKRELAETAQAWLTVGKAVDVRNAADLLGTFGYRSFVAPLQEAALRGDLDVEARVAIARAFGRIANLDANPTLVALMSDSEPMVRLQAVESWRRILRQADAAPVAALVTDGDLAVRRTAIAVVGQLREASALAELQEIVVSDADPSVRRNAAWALGQIGDRTAEDALRTATGDESGLVRMTAKSALRLLR